LDGDLRTLVPEYSGVSDVDEKNYVDEIAEYINNLLVGARGILENEKLTKRQMLVASSILNEVEECLVWITPSALALPHITDLLSKMADIKDDTPYKKEYKSMLEKSKIILETVQDKNEILGRQETERYRASIEECINFIYSQSLKDIINTGLQIERLRSLCYWGSALLLLFVLIFPVVSNIEKWRDFQIPNAIFGPDAGLAITMAIGFSIIGGIGGFLSGLQQVRATKTDLGDYEISVLLFKLRPILGGFAALLLTVLMSWGILSDVIAETQGSYLLVAFASGFSERYFINLLKLNGNDTVSDTTASSRPVKENGQNKQGDGTKSNGAGE